MNNKEHPDTSVSRSELDKLLDTISGKMSRKRSSYEKHKNTTVTNKKHNTNNNTSGVGKKYRKTKSTYLNTTNLDTTLNSNRIVKLVNDTATSAKKIKSRSRFTKHNYIKQLIHQYYDNDKVADQYLKSAHRKIHIYPPQHRIIIIGDIHGDFEAAIKCLVLSRCIEEPQLIPKTKSISEMTDFFDSLKWIGGDTYIIQLGDQIDRIRPQTWDSNNIANHDTFDDEGSTLELFYLFNHLDTLAKQHEGRVLCIIGNHEIMNVEGDFRYVSKKEFHSFNQHLATTYHKNCKYPYTSRTLKKNHKLLNNSTYKPPGYRERLYAFAPSGLCSNLIADNYYTILQVGSWLICHGGPTLNTLSTYNIELLNNIVSLYLLGMDSKSNHILDSYLNIINPTNSSDDGILWSREFSEKIKPHSDQEHQLEKDIINILEQYNIKNNPGTKAKYVAVGHTPQFHSGKGINSVCNGRVWRCDVGMSKAFGDLKDASRKPQVLEILNDNTIKVLS